MASKLKAGKPRVLEIQLNDPGMTAIHRAGLGGLASTLAALQREVKRANWQYGSGNLTEGKIPGHPWPDEDSPPWEILRDRLILDFGSPENAGAYLQRLFAYAFQIRNGLAFLPGQHANPPKPEVLAALQEGLLSSFLQHGKSRVISKKFTTLSYDVGEKVPATLNFRELQSYAHQSLWEKLIESDGHLTSKPREIAGPLLPGSAVRHVAFTGKSAATGTASQLLVLAFALVGCLTLVVSRRNEGVMVIPQTFDLADFARFRPRMSPGSAKECQVTSPSDAALQAQLRLWVSEHLELHQVPSCTCFTFSTQPWAKQQKSRSHSVSVSTKHSDHLRIFEIALQNLPPRVQLRKDESSAFWGNSVVRPLIAENLALNKPWYADFTRLMTAYDHTRKPAQPLRQQIQYERTALNAMIQKMPHDHEGEKRLVQAVHTALRSRYGQIANENKGNSVAMKKRFGNEYERLRLAFSGAKTPDIFRHVLCDLFARAGRSETLQDHWQDLLPMLHADQWQFTRDLALLALASYKGAGEEATHAADSESLSTQA